MHTGKFSFIMTKADDPLISFERGIGAGKTRQIFIHEMICAFNREGFLNPDNIFSSPVPGLSRDYIDGASIYQIVFPNDFGYSVPTHDFSSHHLFDETKPENQLLFSMGGGYSDMAWYLSEIRTGNNPYSNKIRDALGI